MRQLALLALFWSLPLYSKDYRPEVLPVKLQMTDKGQWQLIYQVPCDAEEMGLFFSAVEGGQIKIGMAVSRFHQRCASFGPIKTFILSRSISESLMDIDLVSFNPAIEAQRYRLIYPAKIAMGNTKGQAPHLSLVYETNCGPMLGVVVVPKTDGTEVAVLESEDASQKNCLINSLRLDTVQGIRLQGPIRPMNSDVKTASGRPHYQLRLQTIKPGSLQVINRQQGLVGMQYQRRCHQAPIGLVTQHRSDHTLIAVLVAEYPQEICAPGAADRMWSVYQTRILDTTQLNSMRPARIPSQLKLELLSGTAVHADRKQITFAGYGDVCRIKPVPVYVEQNGELYFGMLNAQTPHQACRGAITELTLERPRDPHLAWSGPVKTLRLSR